MEWRCFWELTGLEKAAILGAASVGSIFILVGFILMFRRGSPLLSEITVWFETKFGKFSAFLPFPFACILVGCLFIAAGGWLFARSFPAHNLSFSYGPWTLADIKERVERQSKVRVDLKGEAASFKVDKDFSGACATDLVASICEYYDPSKLQCEHPTPGTFIIAVRP
jgi:hypothetical protein